MATKITLTDKWQQISDGTKASIIRVGRFGYGAGNCEIEFATAAPANTVSGIPVGDGANIPATSEKVYAKGQGDIMVSSYTPK